jgi:hypothetical protein
LGKGWLAWYLVYGLGLLIIWKGTSCKDWDGGWIRKVTGVRTGFMVSFCLNQLRIGSYQSTIQDKLCHHVSGMEQLAD